MPTKGAPRAKARARRVGTGLVGIAISVVAIAVLVTLIDIGDTMDVLAGTNLWLGAATLLLVPAQIVLRTFRWRAVLPLRPDGTRPEARRIMPVLLAGYLANLVLPARLGEPVRAFLLSRREQIAFAPILGSVVLERVLDLASLAPLAALAALQVGAPEWIVRGTIIATVIGLVLVGILVASGITRGIEGVERLLGARGGRVRAVLAQLAHFGEGASGGGWGQLVLAYALSAATWAFVAATFWFAAQSLGIDIRISAAILVAAIASLGTSIPSAPANIGTFEAAAVVALTALGVPAHEALAMALLTHAIVTLPFAVIGAAAVGFLSISLTDVADEAAAAIPAAPPEADPA